MKANYIYDIFETTRENKLPDLYIGLAMLQHDKPVPEETTDQELREFIGRHYDTLVKAYKTRDRDAFAAMVARCEEEDAERRAAQEDVREEAKED